MTARYVVERASVCDLGIERRYAPQHWEIENDWEVLDLGRIATRRVLCRATRSDALIIAAALNASQPVVTLRLVAA